MTYVGMSGKGSAFRAIFELATAVGAQGCAVLDADLRSVSPAWIDRLIGPVLEHGQDLVTPLYARHKLDGTITNSIAFPLTAAMYGRRLRQPIGGDFGFSGRLAAHWAAKQVWSTDVARFGVDIWMTTVALCEGFSVCQSVLGAKLHDAKDPGRDLGPMFRQVVGSLFALAGRYVDRWTEVDAIADVPTYGFRTATSTERSGSTWTRWCGASSRGTWPSTSCGRRSWPPSTSTGSRTPSTRPASGPRGSMLGRAVGPHLLRLPAGLQRPGDRPRPAGLLDDPAVLRARRPSSARPPTTPPSRPRSGSRPPRCSWPPSPT